MREFFAVFITGFKYCWRDPMGVAILTVFPIAIIFVLGSALGGFISPDYDFEPFPVAAVIEEGGNLEEFLQSEEITRFLVVTFTDKESAEELLESGEANIVIFEEDGTVLILRKQGAGLEAQIPTSVIDSYVQIGAAMTLAMMNGGDFAELSGLIHADISVVEAPLGTRMQSAIDYYAVTMLVMILMFAGINGLELFKKNMFSETGERVLSTPVPKASLVGGLLAASTLTAYLQGMVTFLFSSFVYGAYWGERIPLILLTLFGVTLFSQAFAIFVSILLKSPGATLAFMQSLIWVMTFVAGGYVKIDFGAADAIFRYSPNSLAHTVIFGASFGGNESRMMSDLTLIFIYSGVLFILAFLLGKRRLTK